jgi:hypothetical protein
VIRHVWSNFATIRGLIEFGFPFTIGTPSGPVGRFRALARRTRFPKRSAKHFAARTAVTLGWPIGALWRSIAEYHAMRQDVGAPLLRGTLKDMLWRALRHGVPPLEYRLYRMCPGDGRDVDLVFWNDGPGLAALSRARGADMADVQDKARFAQIARDQGLPHIATLAQFDGKAQLFPEQPFVPDQPGLWIKPNVGRGGGARWVLCDGMYSDARGRRLTPSALAEESLKAECIVQPLMQNHPAITALGTEALATLRLVTGMTAAGDAVVVAGFLVLGRSDHPTTVNGIICGLDEVAGRITRAIAADGMPMQTHPDSGVRLAGAEIPFFHDSVALVLRAHQSGWPRFLFLGWDVALTAEGPVLVETNVGWGAMYHQLLDGPMTRFAQLVDAHV